MKYSEIKLILNQLTLRTPWGRYIFQNCVDYGYEKTIAKYFLNKHIFNKNHWRRQYNDK